MAKERAIREAEEAERRKWEEEEEARKAEEERIAAEAKAKAEAEEKTFKENMANMPKVPIFWSLSACLLCMFVDARRLM